MNRQEQSARAQGCFHDSFLVFTGGQHSEVCLSVDLRDLDGNVNVCGRDADVSRAAVRDMRPIHQGEERNRRKNRQGKKENNVLKA